MIYESRLKNKFIEFLKYINIEENEIPNYNSNVLFKDNTKMCFYFTNNELRIRRFLQSNITKEYPIATKKLKNKIEILDEKIKKAVQLKILKRYLMEKSQDNLEKKNFVKKI